MVCYIPASPSLSPHYLIISSNFTLVTGQTHFCLFGLSSPPPTGKEKQDASEGNGDAMEQGVPLRIS